MVSIRLKLVFETFNCARCSLLVVVVVVGSYWATSELIDSIVPSNGAHTPAEPTNCNDNSLFHTDNVFVFNWNDTNDDQITFMYSSQHTWDERSWAENAPRLPRLTVSAPTKMTENSMDSRWQSRYGKCEIFPSLFATSILCWRMENSNGQQFQRQYLIFDEFLSFFCCAYSCVRFTFSLAKKHTNVVDQKKIY